jgi:hypothetical protein
MIGVFFATISNKKVKAALRKKKTMGLVVDRLPTKIPDVNTILLPVPPNKFPSKDVNSLC